MRMREIMADETFQLALLTVKDANLPLEVAHDDADAIASVRMLSRGAGYNKALLNLLSTGDPLPAKPEEEESEYIDPNGNSPTS